MTLLSRALLKGARQRKMSSKEIVRCIKFIRTPTDCPNKFNHYPITLKVIEWTFYNLLNKHPKLKPDRNGRRKDYLLLSLLVSPHTRPLSGKALEEKINSEMLCKKHQLVMETKVKLCEFVGLTRKNPIDEPIVISKGKAY